ncbi:MAG: glycerophosphodiester phosphodiesterase family protein [Bacteroidota bacterium]
MHKILNIAHRGAKAYAPENTLSAFQKAMEMYADGIELDVHLCKTGEIVVIHDFTVDRTTNGSGTVSSLTLSELKTLKINSTPEEAIPLLTEVIALLPASCLINIELKGKELAKPIMELIEHCVSKENRVYRQFIISSFDWVSLMDIHLANPKIPLGVLTELDLELALAFAKFIEAQSIHAYFHLLTKENTEKIQKEGIQVFAWTVNEIEDIQKIKSFNVNGIISDYPDRL